MAIIVSNPSTVQFTGASPEAQDPAAIGIELGFTEELAQAMQPSAQGSDSSQPEKKQLNKSGDAQPMGLQILPPDVLLSAVEDANFAYASFQENTESGHGSKDPVDEPLLSVELIDPSQISDIAASALAAQLTSSPAVTSHMAAPQTSETGGTVIATSVIDHVNLQGLNSVAGNGLSAANENVKNGHIQSDEGMVTGLATNPFTQNLDGSSETGSPQINQAISATSDLKPVESMVQDAVNSGVPTIAKNTDLAATNFVNNGQTSIAGLQDLENVNSASQLTTDALVEKNLTAFSKDRNFDSSSLQNNSLNLNEVSVASNENLKKEVLTADKAQLQKNELLDIDATGGKANFVASIPLIKSETAAPSNIESVLQTSAIETQASTVNLTEGRLTSVQTGQSNNGELPLIPSSQDAINDEAALKLDAGLDIQEATKAIPTNVNSRTALPDRDLISDTFSSNTQSTQVREVFNFTVGEVNQSAPTQIQNLSLSNLKSVKDASSTDPLIDEQLHIESKPSLNVHGKESERHLTEGPSNQQKDLSVDLVVENITQNESLAQSKLEKNTDAAKSFEEISSSFVSSLVGGPQRPITTVMDWVALKPQETPRPVMPHELRLDAGAVQVEIQKMVKQGGGHVVMELTPPDQSKFTIELKLDDKGGAYLIVEGVSDSTKTRLEQSAPQLQEQFQQMGLNLQLDMRQNRDSFTTFSQGNSNEFGENNLPQETSPQANRVDAADRARKNNGGQVYLYA